MSFDIRMTDLRALNSATKYPSIPTYHTLDPKDGSLLDETVRFSGYVIGTEKVDGASGRIIAHPGGWIIGSREELLHAQGDLIANPSLGIVDALRDLAERIVPHGADPMMVFYLEVYGGGIGSGWKQYASDRSRTGFRLFDVARFDDYEEILSWPVERIASWRQHGGQPFLDESGLYAVAEVERLPMTPRLFEVDAAELPTDLEKTRAFVAEHAPGTAVALDDGAKGSAEGIVLRARDRSAIAKARLQDYDRTIKRRQGGGRRG